MPIASWKGWEQLRNVTALSRWDFVGSIPWHMSQPGPADTEPREAPLSSSVCRKEEVLFSASPPRSGAFLTRKLQEAGHDHKLEPC